MDKKIKVSGRVNKLQRQKLELLAEQTGTSIYALINRAVADWLDRQPIKRYKLTHHCELHDFKTMRFGAYRELYDIESAAGRVR